MLHLCWRMHSSDEQWAQLFRNRYFRDGAPIKHYMTSSIWQGIKPFVDTVQVHSRWIMGDGLSVKFWSDKWLSASLVDLLQIPENLLKHLSMPVSDFSVDGRWLLPSWMYQKFPDISQQIINTTLCLEPQKNSFIWMNTPDGVLSTKVAFSFFSEAVSYLPWCRLVWNIFVPPSRCFIFWRFAHNKLPTDDNLRKRGCVVVSVCCFCYKALETSAHIFLDCPETAKLWQRLEARSKHPINRSTGISFLFSTHLNWEGAVREVILSAKLHVF